MKRTLPAFIIALCVVGWFAGSLRADHSADLAESGITCSPWTQVNDGAFGLGEGAYPGYNGEEGFEVAVFNGQLHLGMEADSSLGARLWRTRAQVSVPLGQADWEEVIADATGLPWGIANIPQVDHVDSVAVFQNALYVSSANSQPAGGTLLFRSATGAPGSWALAAPPGFEDSNNINFKDMQVFDGRLCGGTQNWVTGAQVWCTADGETWTQANLGGFGDRSRVEVWSGHVFRGALYFGVQDRGASSFSAADDVAMLFRTTDLDGAPVWRQVYAGPPGSYRIDILGDLYGYLYISHRSPDGILILRSPSGGADSWEQVNMPGMDGNPRRFGTVVDGATVYGGALYVAVSDTVGGVTLWRTTGIPAGDGSRLVWERVGGPGIVDPNNLYAELIPFNGHLYAWTSNYRTGQQVLRAKCSAVSPSPTPGAGTGEIAGRVWYDAADDGYAALPDQGIGGVQVELTEAGRDGVFGTPDDVIYPGGATDADGRFRMAGLPAGRYRLDVREDTFPQQFAALKAADGGLHEVLLAAYGQAEVSLPYLLVASAGLSGYVWHDLNANGWWDDLESPMPGILVRLYYAGLDGIFGTADDFAKQTARTDPSGRYSFSDLPPGRYRAAIAADQLAPDMTPTVDWFDPERIFLQEGQKISWADFGFAQGATAVLDGVVWEDRNRDGMRTPDEPGLAGVSLQLTGAGPDGSFGTADDAFYSATTTDADGVYRFRRLVPGRYVVILFPYTLPFGYSLPNSAYSPPYELASGQHLTGVDFGLFHDYVELTLAASGTPSAAMPGDPITYTVTVTNTGTITATHLRLNSTISACPGGLKQESEMPGWVCTWAQEHSCLYARCEKDMEALAPAETVVFTQTIQTLMAMPDEVESVQAEIAIAGDSASHRTRVVTPIVRPPAALEGSIQVEGSAEALSEIMTTGIFITVTDIETGAQVTAFADANGRYRIGGLPGGVYRVEVPADLGPVACASGHPVTLTLRYGQELTLDFLYRSVPVPVVLAFRATTSAKGVHVGWLAEDEGLVEAYRVWRGPASTGPFRSVSQPIPRTGAAGRSLYAWLDVRPGDERWYLLELLPGGRRIGPVFARSDARPRVFLPLLIAHTAPPGP